MNQIKMRLGADPEVFLRNEADGKLISVIGLIGADKWNPLQMTDLPQGFTLQEDNVALEFGIPPAASADDFVSYIQTVMQDSLKYVYSGLRFSKLSCVVFDEDQMQHPLAYVFGCEPDYNAWTGEENKKPQPPHKYMRSAGGHIHVETDQDPQDVVKRMDFFLSIPLVLMDEYGHERKKSYGKSGAMRKKPYGVEYRTPSNWWVAPGETNEVRESRCRWVWKQTQRALETAMTFDSTLQSAVIKAIDENDKGLAKSLVDQYQLEVL